MKTNDEFVKQAVRELCVKAEAYNADQFTAVILPYCSVNSAGKVILQAPLELMLGYLRQAEELQGCFRSQIR